MHSWKSIVALTLLVALLAPVVVLARTYRTYTVDVPFEFTIGDRKFKPGTYIFVILGPGLMALENSKKHVITTLITRDIRAVDDADSPHTYFDSRKGHKHLVALWMGKGEGGRGLEVVGEQVAMRQNEAPPPLPLLPEGPSFKMPNTVR